MPIGVIPKGRLNKGRIVQPSLRDYAHSLKPSQDYVLGYSQSSLRDSFHLKLMVESSHHPTPIRDDDTLIPLEESNCLHVESLRKKIQQVHRLHGISIL